MATLGTNFREVVGFEDYYEVSDRGEIFSKITMKFRKPVINQKNGYAYVVLCNPKKKLKRTIAIHRIVAEAWLQGEKLECINHKNEDKLDNRVSNLEWCTKAYNNTYNGKTQRCCKSVAMCDLQTHEVIQVFPSARIAEKHAMTNYKNISAVCHGKRKSAGGYEWRFV